MDAAGNHDASSPSASVSVNSGGPESEFNKSSTSKMTSSGGDILREIESTGEIITNFELDIACIGEKLANLNLLSMRVETKESDFEAFVPDMDPNASDLDVKALEFDFLSGFLNSEVKVLEMHISDLQIDKTNIRELLSSHKHLAESLVGMEDMLHDSEKSLEQSLEQVLEIKVRSEEFQRKFLRFAREETCEDKDYAESSNNDDLPELKEKMKMQTVEHQRHILRMLEKSLERELDLEKRVTESTQMEEALTMRLLYAEEEAGITLEKFYEADHTSELLIKTSRELLTEIKILQFNLRGLAQREAELKRVLLEFEKRVKDSNFHLDNENPSMEETGETENTIKDLKKQITEADNRIVSAEAKYNELEKELSYIRLKLQHAEACYEASQEEKSMLNSTINDMGNVIEDLKKKVSQAEIQTDSVEDKCIFLSESNADLKKELSSVRGRVKCLETSLHQTEEIKNATAKDISLRTKLIMDLVRQMALERERLQKQMSSLKQENKILVKRLKRADKDPAGQVTLDDKAVRTENRESLSTSFEADKAGDKTVSPNYSASEFETTRNIDARELKLKFVLLLLFVLIIPLFAVLFHQIQGR